MTAAGFRGSIAPASLKYSQDNHQPKESDMGFRGSIAPASLKCDLGLVLVQGAVRVSGALLPRPH